MYNADVVALLNSALRVSVMMAAPVLIFALVTGIVIGLLQALTSIQEMTLTFVPKLAVIVIVFAMTAGSTGAIIVQFFEDKILTIVGSSGLYPDLNTAVENAR